MTMHFSFRHLACSAAALLAVPAAGATDDGADLSYVDLMRQSVERRVERLENAPDDARRRFLARLEGAHVAVLVVDPADCSGWARVKRLGLATGEQAPGAGEGAVAGVASSVTRGALNFALPGLGSLLGGVAQANEARKGIGGVLAYRDVCDLAEEEKAALLSPQQEPPQRADPALVDRVSKFLTR